MTQRGRHGMLALVGFILSPLSWWNDLLVNVPLAYALATPFALLDQRLFLPAFVTGYWLTNVVGLMLLHRGTLGLFQPDRSPARRRGFLVATLYTLLIVLLVLTGLLPDPQSLLNL